MANPVEAIIRWTTAAQSSISLIALTIRSFPDIYIWPWRITKKKMTFTVELSNYSIFLNSVSHSVNWYSDEQLCYLYRNRFADLVQRCLFFQCFFFMRNTTQQNALEPIFSVEGPHILLSIELEIKWGRSRMNKNHIINKPRWKRRKKKHISKWSIGEWPLHCEVFAMTHEKKVLSKFILIWLKR